MSRRPAARVPVFFLAVLGLSLAPGRLDAAFHLWQFTEVFSNADGSVQFIEMRTPFNSEHLLAGHTLTSNGKAFNVTTNLPSSSTANKHFIFATAAYAALPGAVAPDYIIPPSFFDVEGDFIDWEGWDSFQINPGQFPLDGFHSLLDNGTTAENSPTNFAGLVGRIDLRVVPGDTNGDSKVDIIDLNNVRNNFGAAGPNPAGDTNNDDQVDIVDLNNVRNNFGAGAASAVPEPPSVALIGSSLAAFALAYRRSRRGPCRARPHSA